jgi:hypothetical protein
VLKGEIKAQNKIFKKIKKSIQWAFPFSPETIVRLNPYAIFTWHHFESG